MTAVIAMRAQNIPDANIPDANINIVPRSTSVIPIQIRGFVTLCTRIVVSVQYGEWRPKNPSRSITRTAPSPMTNPMMVMRVAIYSIVFTIPYYLMMTYATVAAAAVTNAPHAMSTTVTIIGQFAIVAWFVRSYVP